MKKLLLIAVALLISSVQITAQIDSCTTQMPGDLTSNGVINMTDHEFLVNYLRGLGRAPDVLANADVNGNCVVDFDDANYLYDYLNSGGVPPVDCTCNIPDVCSYQSPGDFDKNGFIDISDMVFMVSILSGGALPYSLSDADVNGDCEIDVEDVVALSWGWAVDCTCMSPKKCDSSFTPGDLNNDSNINIYDLYFLTSFISGYGEHPEILAYADVDGDCIVDFNDIAFLDNYLNNSGEAPSECICYYTDTCAFQYPGDVDNSGSIDINDLVFLVNFLNLIGPAPPILANADFNGDCIVDDNDATALELFITAGGEAPDDCTCISPDYVKGQKPGDFDSNELFNMLDITFFDNYLHGTGPAPAPIANADANGDCIINIGDSKYLYDFLVNNGPPPVDNTCTNPAYLTECCWGYIGNVNYDALDKIDVSDLVWMVSYMFTGGDAPICFEEADFVVSGSIDISDLVFLITWMFQGGPPPPLCQ